MGKHISNIIPIKAEENVIGSMPVYDFDNNNVVTFFTKNGMIKRTNIKEFKALRYNKPIVCIKLKGDDKLVDISYSDLPYVFITTNNGYGLNYKIEEVPITGLKTSGVKAISLKNDFVVDGHIYNDDYEYLTVITDKKTAKRIRLTEFDIGTRARRGLQIIKDVKTNPYKIVKTFIIDYKKLIGIKTATSIVETKITDFPISDRYKTGSTISKLNIIDSFVIQELVSKEKKKIIEKENVSLDDVDKKILTIDDFLDDIENN